MENNKLTALRWYDIISLTVIFFAYAIYVSTRFFISSFMQTYYPLEMDIPQNALEFSNSDNYITLILQVIFLCLGILYLKLRKFDFKIFPIRFSIKAVGLGIVFFFGAALCMDLYTMLVFYIPYLPIFPSVQGGAFMQLITGIRFSTIIYAVLNGFYEEFFFLGICTAVQDKYKKWVFIYSLFIRFSFHTYQGLSIAVGLGVVLGTFFYFLYTKSKTKNLLPFFIAHTIADISGLTVLNYFFY